MALDRNITLGWQVPYGETEIPVPAADQSEPGLGYYGCDGGRHYTAGLQFDSAVYSDGEALELLVTKLTTDLGSAAAPLTDPNRQYDLKIEPYYSI